MTLSDSEIARREKFLHHVKFFDASSRFPSPYIGFTGRPGYQFQIHCMPYDEAGFLNPETVRPRNDTKEIRVFVVGDSTMATGTELENTVPKQVEKILRDKISTRINVYNFAVVSSNTEQMSSLIWSRLLDLDPDLIVIVSGGTDAFQPYSFDPRPGFPYNFFLNEFLYVHYFDENNDRAWRSGLDYDAAVTEAFDHRTRLREVVEYGSLGWEEKIASSYTGSLIKIIRAAKSVNIPIFYFLEPIVVRTQGMDLSEPRFASPDTLAYLSRQYDRFESAIHQLQKHNLPKNLKLVDASRIIGDNKSGEFYDILHYDRVGVATMARFISEQLLASELEIKIPRLAEKRVGWMHKIFGRFAPRR